MLKLSFYQGKCFVDRFKVTMFCFCLMKGDMFCNLHIKK